MDKRLEAFARLLEVMDRLRVECPWDAKQTIDTLKNHTVEETFELVDAINSKDYENICEELGDVLLHIVFYAKIGEEEGRFDIADVSNKLCDKLIYRHPHVFGTTTVESSEEVTRNWEALKQKKNSKGAMAGVPSAMPAMIKAARVQQKAAASGFDWDEKADVWDKVSEEIGELATEIKNGNTEKMTDEFGDVFFSLINAARLYNVDPEAALEHTNRKFIGRYNYMEQAAAESSRSLKEMSLDEMNELWDEAKTLAK